MAFDDDGADDVFEAGGRGMQHHGLRRANEKAVLTVVGFNPGVSNAQIARKSGLAPQTVSAILGDIERAGLIRRGPVMRGRRGQPATPIFLRPEGGYAIGVDIGWRQAELVLIDLNANIVSSRRLPYAIPDPASIVAALEELVAAVKAELPQAARSRLLDLGVALPADMADGLRRLGASAAQVTDWQAFDISAALAARTGLEVNLFNDGNAACWAELIARPRPRPGNFIYFLVGTSLAAGIVADGKLWEGPTGKAANLGAMVVHVGADGPGMARHIAALAALEERLHRAGMDQAAADPALWDWPKIGNAVDRWIEDSAEALARVCFNTSTVIESHLVVLDSILPGPLTARLAKRLAAALAALPVPSYAPPEILVGQLGRQAPALGAAELPLFRRYF